MTGYLATFHYQDLMALPDVFERETSVRFRRDDGNHRFAAMDAVAFYENRHKEFPQTFPTLWCLKLYLFRLPTILASGSLSFHENGGLIFEWKHDWGGTIEDYIQMRLK